MPPASYGGALCNDARCLSKVIGQVTRLIYALTEDEPYLRNPINFKLGMHIEYRDPRHRHARQCNYYR